MEPGKLSGVPKTVFGPEIGRYAGLAQTRTRFTHSLRTTSVLCNMKNLQLHPADDTKPQSSIKLVNGSDF
ncbi:hypothetical protein M407DRAFT_245049 [Tulasnella calospora MUT 4182]|uniref:Uncharacterized protein n=1 Tax=Tulasnella calospora MUT 4182 TaxID=1051891 RepID=A0A0C3LN79_9AGAM|nr:hypothetical protein M407DRAFT_246693 [Tulasnella calospora MUT 4182]KIO22792.1 hypothetical protein M407DRAFT_245049 [Tulasnella calospora MUT 4182]